ncbi:MAG: hypothetical protein RLZZ450_4290 [Pseudomonadota bacterium]|jgi:2-dehydropantoate 2-reductase
MRIALIGPGAIGSTFAYQLAKAGHDVTVVARGARLRWLEQERAIVRHDSQRAPVTVSAELDSKVAWDLLIVTVLATQVEPLLPVLRASAARRVVFMFNTFESLAPLREAVGAERFSFAFPGGVFTLLTEGRIRPQIRSGTSASEPALAKLFCDAGIPTVFESDMQSWLRSHGALVVPLMAMGTVVCTRKSGASWRESRGHAAAFAAGIATVRAVGSDLRPGAVAWMARLPLVLITAALWALSRTKIIRELGLLGATEPRMLIDMMSAAAPALAGPLRDVRP